MSVWGTAVQPGKDAVFSCEDGSLDLTQVTLTAGKSALVKFRLNEHGPLFCICNLTEARPNCTTRLLFEEDVQFIVEGPRDANVSLTGNLRLHPEETSSCDDDTFSSTDELEHMLGDLEDSSESSVGSESERSSPRIVEVTEAEAEQIRRGSEQKKEAVAASTTGAIALPPPVEKKEPFGSQLTKAASKRGQAGLTTESSKKPRGGSGVAKEDLAEKPVTARVLPGGVKYEVLKIGSGKIANVGHRVKVKYEGRLARNGKKFDAGSLDFTLGSGDMIKGFDLGVRGMLLQEKRRIFIPARLGYGKQSVGGIPPNSDLTFEVSLLAVS